VTLGSFPGTTQCTTGPEALRSTPTTQRSSRPLTHRCCSTPVTTATSACCSARCHRVGYTGKVFSGDGSDSATLISGTNPHSGANGVYASCGCAVLGTTQDRQGVRDGLQGARALRPGDLLGRVVRRGEHHHRHDEADRRARRDGGHHRQNLVTALHQITYVGLTKTIAFKADGDIAGTTIYVNKVDAAPLCSSESSSTTQHSVEEPGTPRLRGVPGFLPSSGPTAATE